MLRTAMEEVTVVPLPCANRKASGVLCSSLNEHEGQSCQRDVRLLYAGKPFPKLRYCKVNGDIASGDLCNVFKTGRVSTTINDREFQVVARNIPLAFRPKPYSMWEMISNLLGCKHGRSSDPSVVFSIHTHGCAIPLSRPRHANGRRGLWTIQNREEDALLGKTWKFPS